MSHKPRKQAADLKHGPTPDSDENVMQLLDELRSNQPGPVELFPDKQENENDQN